jgi:hypothetical protein
MKTLIALVTLLSFSAHASLNLGLVKFGSIGPSL